jgi:hypothetical protein
MPTKVAKAAAYYRRHGRHDLADRLEHQLAAAGRCVMCGRELRNPRSVADAIGPECRRKQS